MFFFSGETPCLFHRFARRPKEKPSHLENPSECEQQTPLNNMPHRCYGTVNSKARPNAIKSNHNAHTQSVIPNQNVLSNRSDYKAGMRNPHTTTLEINKENVRDNTGRNPASANQSLQSNPSGYLRDDKTKQSSSKAQSYETTAQLLIMPYPRPKRPPKDKTKRRCPLGEEDQKRFIENEAVRLSMM